MAGRGLSGRVDALEGRLLSGHAVWLVLEPGETEADAIARYQAGHEPDNASAVNWNLVRTGVPRGELSICALT